MMLLLIVIICEFFGINNIFNRQVPSVGRKARHADTIRDCAQATRSSALLQTLDDLLIVDAISITDEFDIILDRFHSESSDDWDSTSNLLKDGSCSWIGEPIH